MNFADAIKICLKKKYANFSGRASRSEFWFFTLFILIVYTISILIIFKISLQFLWVFGVFAIGMIVPALSVTVRRLHDINKSGWFILLPLPAELVAKIFERSSESFGPGLSIIFSIIAIVLYVYLFALYCKDGDKKNNRFGKNIYKKIIKRKKRN